MKISTSSSAIGWVTGGERGQVFALNTRSVLGFYLLHENMLESVIYARDKFLSLPTRNDDNTPDQNESIVIFPSHAYLVCYWRAGTIASL